MSFDLLENLGEVISIQEIPVADESEFLDALDMEMLEQKQFFSEVDELRVNETAEIMTEIFSEEVLRDWPEMSQEERAEKLNEYYVRAGENLGIETKGVIVEPIPSKPGIIFYGYNSCDGYIHLNEAVVNNPECLEQVLVTSTHEMRHQFQSDVLACPEKFPDIPQDVLDTWRYEMDPRNYIRPEYDYEGYYNQKIESDARGFADNVLGGFLERMYMN